MPYRALIPKAWYAACCQHCGAQSEPRMFDAGITVFPGPFDLLKGEDRTQEVVSSFAREGWKIEPNKATCLDCRAKFDREGAAATQIAT